MASASDHQHDIHPLGADTGDNQNSSSSVPDIVQRSQVDDRSRQSNSNSRYNLPARTPQGFSGFRLTNTMVTARHGNSRRGNSSSIQASSGNVSGGNGSQNSDSHRRSRPSHARTTNNVRPASSSSDQGLVPSNNGRNPQGLDNPALQNAAVDTRDIQPGIHSPARRQTNEPLPDLVDSLALPPYIQARRNQHRETRHQHQRRSRGQRQTGSRSSRMGPGTTQLSEEDRSCCCCGHGCNRDCCLDCLTVVTTFRWVLVALSLLGVFCIVTGIVLGALHMAIGDSFLTLSLMFIGLGVMLVVVVGVGWKCTPHGHEPCHLLFNLGAHSPNAEAQRRRMRRRSRRNQWHGGVLYPEFRNRRPPPTYSASQQEYEQQMAQAQVDAGAHENADNNDNYSLPSSPPPTYRSHASTVRTGVEITFPPQPDSRPPTYRSHASEGPSHPRPPLPNDIAEASCCSAVAVGTEGLQEEVVVTVSSSEDGTNSLPSTNTSSTAGTRSGTISDSLPASTPASAPVSTPASAPVSTPASASSTMHRVLQAVRYFDDQLNSGSSGQLSTEPSSHQSANSRQGTLDRQRPGSASSRVMDTQL